MTGNKFRTEFPEVVDNPNLTKGILELLGKYKMAETIWGTQNSHRPDDTHSFWNAWRELLIIAEQETVNHEQYNFDF